MNMMLTGTSSGCSRTLVAAFVVVPLASSYNDRNFGSTARRNEVAAACAAAVAAAPSFRATEPSAPAASAACSRAAASVSRASCQGSSSVRRAMCARHRVKATRPSSRKAVQSRTIWLTSPRKDPVRKRVGPTAVPFSSGISLVPEGKPLQGRRNEQPEESERPSKEETLGPSADLPLVCGSCEGASHNHALRA